MSDPASTPPTEGDFLGGSAAPFPVTHDGKTWLIGAPTLGARDALNKFVVVHAMGTARQADINTPGLGVFDQFKADHGQRKYQPGRSRWREWVTGEDSNALFLASLLYQHHPKEACVELAETLIREKPDEVGIAMAEVIPGFFDLLAADKSLPPELREGFRAGATVLRSRSKPPGS